MSSEATTSKTDDTAKQISETQKEGDQIPHLSVLEEDDEFEEFAVQGEHKPHTHTTRTTPLHNAGPRRFRALAETYLRSLRLGRFTNRFSAPREGRARSGKVGGRQTVGR